MSDAPNTTTPTGDRVIVAVDGSGHSQDALREGDRLARALGAPLEAIMCWDSSYLYESYADIDPARFAAESDELLATTLAQVFGEDLPEYLTPRLLRGQAAARLIEESKNAQLLVVGPRGRGGVLGMILGSVSSALISHAHCSVLVARP